MFFSICLARYVLAGASSVAIEVPFLSTLTPSRFSACGLVHSSVTLRPSWVIDRPLTAGYADVSAWGISTSEHAAIARAAIAAAMVFIIFVFIVVVFLLFYG